VSVSFGRLALPTTTAPRQRRSGELTRLVVPGRARARAREHGPVSPPRARGGVRISLRFLTPFLIIFFVTAAALFSCFYGRDCRFVVPVRWVLRAFGSSDGRPLVRSEEVGLAGDSSGKLEADVVWSHWRLSAGHWCLRLPGAEDSMLVRRGALCACAAWTWTWFSCFVF
jgi:hypothetical protein